MTTQTKERMVVPEGVLIARAAEGRMLEAKGTHFYCYSHDRWIPFDYLGKKVRDRYFCQECYPIIREAQRLKEKGDDE